MRNSQPKKAKIAAFPLESCTREFTWLRTICKRQRTVAISKQTSKRRFILPELIANTSTSGHSPRLSLVNDNFAIVLSALFLELNSYSKGAINSVSLSTMCKSSKRLSRSARHSLQDVQEWQRPQTYIGMSPRSGLPAPTKYVPQSHTSGICIFGQQQLQQYFFQDKDVFDGQKIDEYWQKGTQHAKPAKGTSLKSSLKTNLKVIRIFFSSEATFRMF